MNRLTSTTAALVLSTVLMAGCSWETADPQPGPAPAPTTPTPSAATPTLNVPGPGDAGGGKGQLARNPGSWRPSDAGDVRVPAGMSTVMDETVGRVYAAVFNAGEDPRPKQVARWIRKQNPDVKWTVEETAEGVRLVGGQPGRPAPLTVDVLDTPAGVLVRVLSPAR